MCANMISRVCGFILYGMSYLRISNQRTTLRTAPNSKPDLPNLLKASYHHRKADDGKSIMCARALTMLNQRMASPEFAAGIIRRGR